MNQTSFRPSFAEVLSMTAAQKDILIHKRGRGFYAPDSIGYTGDPAQAGRFSIDQAQRMVDFDPDTFTPYRVSETLAGAKKSLSLYGRSPYGRLAIVTEANGAETLYRHVDKWERLTSLSDMRAGAQAIGLMAEEMRKQRRMTVDHDELIAEVLELDGLLVRVPIEPQNTVAMYEPA